MGDGPENASKRGDGRQRCVPVFRHGVSVGSLGTGPVHPGNRGHRRQHSDSAVDVGTKTGSGERNRRRALCAAGFLALLLAVIVAPGAEARDPAPAGGRRGCHRSPASMSWDPARSPGGKSPSVRPRAGNAAVVKILEQFGADSGRAR